LRLRQDILVGGAIVDWIAGQAWAATQQEEEQLIELGLRYAEFVAGERPKSPDGSPFSIHVNQVLRRGVYRIVDSWGLVQRRQPQWEK
jgi:hypothetical protein